MSDWINKLALGIVAERLEHGLLLVCASPDMHCPLDEMVASDKREIDWDYLMRLLKFHALRSGALDRLRRAGIKNLPQPIADALKEREASNWLSSVAHLKALHTIGQGFRQAGIDLAFFKGYALCLQLGLPPQHRQFTDIDILIGEADVTKAVNVIASLGYKPGRWLPIPEWKHAFTANIWTLNEKEYPFSNDEQIVDLHWQIFKKEFCSLSTADLLASSQPIYFDELPLPVIEPNRHALLVAAHASKHKYFLLKWLTDVAAFADNAQVDWQSVHELARSSGAESSLYVSLALAAIISTKARAIFFDHFANNPQLNELVKEILRQAFAMRGESWSTPDDWLYRLRLKPTLRGKLAAIYELSTNAPAWPIARLRLGRVSYQLYRHVYPLKWLWLMPWLLYQRYRADAEESKPTAHH